MMQNMALFCDFENVALGVRDAQYARFNIEEVLERWGRLDIWVNNAGIYPAAKLIEMTDDEWDQTLDVNLKAGEGPHVMIGQVAEALLEVLKVSQIADADAVALDLGGHGKSGDNRASWKIEDFVRNTTSISVKPSSSIPYMSLNQSYPGKNIVSTIDSGSFSSYYIN